MSSSRELTTIPIVHKKSTEVVVPTQDVAKTFSELSHNMEDELERRRMAWEKDVEKMQRDFFDLKPSEPADPEKTKQVAVTKTHLPVRAPGTEIIDINNSRNLYAENPDGTKVYRLRFDVRGFEPGEIQVRAEGNKLHVEASHSEGVGSGPGSKTTKQFNRQMDIPEGVDPDQLNSTLSPDGILSVEAVVDKIPDDDCLTAEPRRAFSGLALPDNEPSLGLSVAPGVKSSYSRNELGSSPISATYYGSSTEPIIYGVGPPMHSHQHHTHVVSSGGPSVQRTVVTGKGGYEPFTMHMVHGSPVLDRCITARGVQPREPRHLQTTTTVKTSSPLLPRAVLEPPSYESEQVKIARQVSTPPGSPRISIGRYTQPLMVIVNGNRKLKLQVDMGEGYQGKETEIKLKGTKLAIYAKHEETHPWKSIKEFSREFDLPEPIEPSTLRAVLSKNGKLIIGASGKTNSTHDEVMESIMRDMPKDGTKVQIEL